MAYSEGILMSAIHASSFFSSRRKPLAACVAALLGLSASGAVQAGTASVTNCADDGSIGSLRWATGQAVNPGDIIDLTGIANFTDCLHNVNGFAQAITLNSSVTVATGVTINGPNTSNSKALAVSTVGADRVFRSPGSITINDLGIKYGKATQLTNTTVYGGCVYTKSGLTLNDVVLDHCEAKATAAGIRAKGGAIATFNGPITMTGTRITNSDATSASGNALGGGVYAFGNITLNSSYVSGTAEATAGTARGGGIAALGAGTVTLTGSEVASAYANAAGAGFVAEGGGVYAGGKVIMNASTILLAGAYQKAAGGGHAFGGGIFAKSGAKLTGSYVVFGYATTKSNAEAKGGGIYSANYVDLEHSFIDDGGTISSSGPASGGGSFALAGTIARYSGVYFASATGSTSQGGGIYSKGGLEFKYGTIQGNEAKEAGGAAVPTGNLYLRGTTISSNSATIASAIAMTSSGGGSTVKIVNSTISGNTVPDANGKYAVFIDAHSTKFYNSTIAYNTGGAGTGVNLTGVVGSTAGLYSTLMSSNSTSGGTQNDFAKSTNVTFTANSSHNLIRHPASIVPTGTLSGPTACPFLHPLKNNGGPTQTHRLGGGTALKNPAIDTGSNADTDVHTDQRGGTLAALTPTRESGIADIGAYEVQHDDIVFDNRFETCPN